MPTPQLTSLFLADVDVRYGYPFASGDAVIRLADNGASIDKAVITLDRTLALQDEGNTTQITIPGRDYSNAVTSRYLYLGDGAALGTYHVVGVSLFDRSGGVVSYDATQLAAAGVDTAFEVGNSVDGDHLRPTLNSIYLPVNVLTNQDRAATTFSVVATDVGSTTIQQATLLLDRPIQTPSGPVTSLLLTGEAGDNSGFVSLTVPITSATEAGSYRVIGVTVYDAAGNVRTYDAPDLSPTYRFTVDDRTAPVLTSLRLPGVDVSNGQITPQILASITDAANNQDRITLYFDRPLTAAGTGYRGSHFTYLTSNLSLYVGQLTAPTSTAGPPLDVTTPAGTYIVTQAVVSDAAGNSTTYSTAQLAELGFDTSLTVAADSVAPLLTSFSLPSSITAKSDAVITVGASDAGTTGLSIRAIVNFDHPIAGTFGGGVYLNSTVSQLFASSSTYIVSGQSGSTTIRDESLVSGSYNVIGLTLFDRAGNQTSYSPEQLRAMGFNTHFDAVNPAQFGLAISAREGSPAVAPFTGRAYFSGTTGASDQVILNGNVWDYTLSRIQPTSFSGASAEQAGAVLLTATNGSGAYAIGQTIENVRFQNGDTLELADLPKFIGGSTTLASGGSGDDILYQDPSLAYQLFIGESGSDDLYLNGNAHDYVARSFSASTPAQTTFARAGSSYSGLELIAINGSGALFVDTGVDTIHFRDGSQVSNAELGGRLAAAPIGAPETTLIALDGDTEQPLVFNGTAGADRVLLQGAPKDYTLSRSALGDFVLDQHRSTSGVSSTLTLSTSIETVQFRDGSRVALADLGDVVSGSAAFSSGGGGDDLLIAAFQGDQYLVGGGGRDLAALNGNGRDYLVRAVDVGATADHPAVHGYALLAINNSGNIYIDKSTETLRFQDGSTIALSDVGASINAAATNATNGADYFIAAPSGEQYFAGGAGDDELFLLGNPHDYQLQPLQLAGEAARPAIDGYKLVATNGSGDIFIDRSIDLLHFQNGTTSSFDHIQALF